MRVYIETSVKWKEATLSYSGYNNSWNHAMLELKFENLPFRHSGTEFEACGLVCQHHHRKLDGEISKNDGNHRLPWPKVKRPN